MSLAVSDFTAPESRLAAGAEVSARIALTLRQISGETWDEALAEFDGAVQEQVYVFARSRWPGVEMQPLLIEEAGVVVGGALAMIQTLPLRIGRMAVVKWGPVFRDNLRPDIEDLRIAATEALIHRYAIEKRMMISIMPRAALTERNPAADYLRGRGFTMRQLLLFPDRYIVSLRHSDAEIRKSFAQKWRYHLNKADKEGLEFEHAPPERMGDFDVLYHAMTDRKKFADHSAYDTLSSLMAVPVDGLRPELFFVRHQGELVAGAVIFKAGDTAVYLYGATNDKALPLRAGYFMHWHIIRWLRDNTRANWYDLGGTDGFQGLHQFKKGMVGDLGVIRPVPPVGNYAESWRAKLAGEGAYLARELIGRIRRRLETLGPDAAKPNQARTDQGDAA
jgi:hypothetical protein